MADLSPPVSPPFISSPSVSKIDTPRGRFCPSVSPEPGFSDSDDDVSPTNVKHHNNVFAPSQLQEMAPPVSTSETGNEEEEENWDDEEGGPVTTALLRMSDSFTADEFPDHDKSPPTAADDTSWAHDVSSESVSDSMHITAPLVISGLSSADVDEHMDTDDDTCQIASSIAEQNTVGPSTINHVDSPSSGQHLRSPTHKGVSSRYAARPVFLIPAAELLKGRSSSDLSIVTRRASLNTHKQQGRHHASASLDSRRYVQSAFSFLFIVSISHARFFVVFFFCVYSSSNT